MAIAADAPKQGFRLSMLIYDTRFRSYTIQVAVLIAAFLFVAWLVDNTVQNLAAKDKDINFGFLWSRAGYDIDQQLIPYTNDSTHGRAAVIGLLNTLLVAFFACIFATLLGVITGILRLSKNWLVARLMTVYVEVFRNVPLLLWIILAFTIFSEAMPEPKDFKVTADILANRKTAEEVAAAVAVSGGFWAWFAALNIFSMAFLAWVLAAIGILGASLGVARRLWQARGGASLGIVALLGPLLIWIVLAFTLFAPALTRAPDLPEGMGPTNPAAQMSFFDTVAVTNRGTNIPAPLLYRPLGGTEVLGVPVNFSSIAVLVVLGLSIWVNSRIRGRAAAVQEATGIRPATWWKSLLVLVVPTAALLLALGLHFEYPAFATDEAGVSKGFNFVGGINVAHSFTALLIALTLYSATYIAEIVRAGILAISRGQTEAAYALGLRPGRTTSLIILPQALRVIIPPLISQFLNITKNTTLGMSISYLDLKGTLGGITLNQTGRELECMLLMMLTYLILSLVISVLMNAYNASVRLKER